MKRGRALVKLVINQSGGRSTPDVSRDQHEIIENDDIPTSTPITNCNDFIQDGTELLSFKRKLRKTDTNYEMYSDHSNSHKTTDYVQQQEESSTETCHSTNLKEAQKELASIESVTDLITPSELGILQDLNINTESNVNNGNSIENVFPTSSHESSDTSHTESPQSSPSSSKRSYPLKTNPGKKRKRDPSLWKSNIIKKMRNTGQEYVNYTGKKVLNRSIKPGCGEKCYRRCHSLISQETRQSLFDNFWEIGDHERQMFYLSKFVKKVEKKVEIKKKEGTSRRKWTYQYFFKNTTVESNIMRNDLSEQNQSSTEIQVCKKTFLNTFDISEIWISTMLKKKKDENSTGFLDLRGKHTVRPNKISEERKEYVRQHIKSMPVKESHYVRKTTSRLFLEEGLSIPKLYTLYVEWMGDSAPEKPVATIGQYRKIFNTEFNIGFFQPKKDQCLLCQIKNHGSAEEKEAKRLIIAFHQANTYSARVFKDMDKARSNSSKELIVACYDMQKVLSTPQSEVSLFYYKRKFAVYNFTVFVLGKSEGHCYLWDETIGKKGPNEIGSALFTFIETEVAQGAKEFIFYSDCCGGQNRNRVIFALYSYACSKFGISITHRFFEVGHSQSEGDSMHALIERRKKHRTVYVPAQWVTLIEGAKVTGKPYKVIEMQQKDILDYKSQISRFPNLGLKATDDYNKKVKWSKIVQLKITKNDPYVIEFEYDYYSEWSQRINLIHREPAKPRTTRRRLDLDQNPHSPTTSHTPTWDEINFVPAYNRPLPLSEAKYKDLNSLCVSGAIPERYRDFYRNLPHSNAIDENTFDDED